MIYSAKLFHRYIAQPIEHIPTYAVMCFWWIFMLVKREYLDECVPLHFLFDIGYYSCADVVKVGVSLLLLRNVVGRKHCLIKKYGDEESRPKMEIDLFEIRFLPIEFNSEQREDEDQIKNIASS